MIYFINNILQTSQEFLSNINNIHFRSLFNTELRQNILGTLLLSA